MNKAHGSKAERGWARLGVAAAFLVVAAGCAEQGTSSTATAGLVLGDLAERRVLLDVAMAFPRAFDLTGVQTPGAQALTRSVAAARASSCEARWVSSRSCASSRRSSA